MKCYNCGHLLPEDSDFCQYCGKRIEKQTSIKENVVEEVIVADETNKTAELPLHNLENATPEEKLNPGIKIQEEAIGTLKGNKKEKNSKIRFCKMCGSQIDAQTKKCSGCGKQYFKGIKFNKFLTTVLILSVVILTSVILNIVQHAKIESLNNKNEYYEKRNLQYQEEVLNLKRENSEYECPKCHYRKLSKTEMLKKIDEDFASN